MPATPRELEEGRWLAIHAPPGTRGEHSTQCTATCAQRASREGMCASRVHIHVHAGTQMPSATCHPIQRNPARIDRINIGSSHPCYTHTPLTDMNERPTSGAAVFIDAHGLPSSNVRTCLRCSVMYAGAYFAFNYNYFSTSAAFRTHEFASCLNTAFGYLRRKRHRVNNKQHRARTLRAHPHTTAHHRAPPCTTAHHAFNSFRRHLISTTAVAGAEQVPRTTPSLRKTHVMYGSTQRRLLRNITPNSHTARTNMGVLHDDQQRRRPEHDHAQVHVHVQVHTHAIGAAHRIIHEWHQARLRRITARAVHHTTTHSAPPVRTIPSKPPKPH